MQKQEGELRCGLRRDKTAQWQKAIVIPEKIDKQQETVLSTY